MTDTIEKIGQSIIQHGPYNQRIYLMKLDRRDTVDIFSDTDRLSKEKGYGKILLKVPMGYVPLLIKRGYEKCFQYRTGPFTRYEQAIFRERLCLWRYTGQQYQYCPRD